MSRDRSLSLLLLLSAHGRSPENKQHSEGVQQRSGTLLTIESIVAALLRVADHLGCARVREAVIQELCTRHYPDQEPPSAAPPRSPPPPPSLSLWARLRTYNDVLSMIAIARAHGIPRVLKRAFYDLIADDGFWLELGYVHGGGSARRSQVSMSRLQLSAQDVIALYRARDVLTRKWRTLALQPPGCTVMPRTGGQVMSRCVSRGDRGGRKVGKQKQMCRGKAAARESARRIDSWRAQMATELEPECGAANVFAHLGLLLGDRDVGTGERKRKQLEETWCWSCLEERKAAWRRARQEWWELLDDLLGVA